MFPFRYLLDKLEFYTKFYGQRQQVHRINALTNCKIVLTSRFGSKPYLTIIGLHLNNRGSVIPSFIVIVDGLVIISDKNTSVMTFSYLPVMVSGIIDITISHGDTPLTRIIKDTCLQC
jgi:hypothetical protein